VADARTRRSMGQADVMSVSRTYKFYQKCRRLPCNSIGLSWIQPGDVSLRHLKGIISFTARQRVAALRSFALTEGGGQIGCRHPTIERQVSPVRDNLQQRQDERRQDVRNGSRGQSLQKRELLSVVILVKHVGLEMGINREVDGREWNVPH
jgi:hypothetical protein